MSAQLALDLPTWPDQPKRSAWAVRVNECGINAVARPARDWWVTFRRFGNEPRICVEGMSVGGDLVHVHCEDQPHADWLASHMLSVGVHASAVKVIRRLECGTTPGDNHD